MKNLGFMGYPLYAIDKNGNVFSIRSNRFLKNNLNSTTKRYRVNLFNEDGAKMYEVHRLVALCFVENQNPEKLNVVNHIDGNSANNYFKNLEWTTHEGNSVHAANNYLWDVRSLSIDDAHSIFKMMEEGLRNKDISDITGVSYSIIAKMRQGENYRDLWLEYRIPYKSHTVSLSKIKYIAELLEQKNTVSDIIRKVNVRRGLVKDIRDGKKFKNLI